MQFLKFLSCALRVVRLSVFDRKRARKNLFSFFICEKFYRKRVQERRSNNALWKKRKKVWRINYFIKKSAWHKNNTWFIRARSCADEFSKQDIKRGKRFQWLRIGTTNICGLRASARVNSRVWAVKRSPQRGCLSMRQNRYPVFISVVNQSKDIQPLYKGKKPWIVIIWKFSFSGSEACSRSRNPNRVLEDFKERLNPVSLWNPE